jgi:hypothetical protein
MATGGNRNPDSPPPAQPPPAAMPRSGGEPYEGIQNEQEWKPGEVDKRGIIDATRKNGLYRLTLVGVNVSCFIRYGTNATLELPAMRTPLVLTLPGQVGVTAAPLSDAGASMSATLVRVTASSLQQGRRYRRDAGAFDPGVTSFYTLEACSITIDGNNYAAVPAFTRLPLVQPAALVTGSGYEEFDT